MRQTFISDPDVSNSKDDGGCFCSYFPISLCVEQIVTPRSYMCVWSTLVLDSWGSTVLLSQLLVPRADLQNSSHTQKKLTPLVALLWEDTDKMCSNEKR